MIKSIQKGKDAKKIALQTIRDSHECSSVKRMKRRHKNSSKHGHTSMDSLMRAQVMTVSLCNDSSIANTGMSEIRLSPLSPFNWAMDHGDVLAILTQSQTKSNEKK